LLADTLEQLGFGSENGTWRNEFLSAAAELRSGNFGTPAATGSADLMAALTIEQLFDAIAVQIDGPRAWHLDLSITWNLSDTGQSYRTTLKNGVFVFQKHAGKPSGLTVTMPDAAIGALALGDLSGAAAAGLTTEGDNSVLASLFGVLSPGDPDFDIVTP
jgi:alkyl sulfatase BDS1-like metallo-beta-lactamase superfamily hydrolase